MKTDQFGQECRRTIGHSRFSQKFIEETLPNLIDKKLQIIKSQRWSIHLDQQWMVVFKSLQETNCENLYITWWLKSVQQIIFPLLNCLGHVSFRSLKQIDIWNCQIQSIEGISHMSIDNIQHLNLSSNLITSLTCLNKTNWKLLQFLILSHNPFNDLNMSRAMMKNVSNYYYTKMGPLQIKAQDLVKLQTTNLRQLIVARTDDLMLDIKTFIQLQKRFVGYKLTEDW